MSAEIKPEYSTMVQQRVLLKSQTERFSILHCHQIIHFLQYRLHPTAGRATTAAPPIYNIVSIYFFRLYKISCHKNKYCNREIDKLS